MMDVHECAECGQMCDCDGDDLDTGVAEAHDCINPNCELSTSDEPPLGVPPCFDDEDCE